MRTQSQYGSSTDLRTQVRKPKRHQRYMAGWSCSDTLPMVVTVEGGQRDHGSWAIGSEVLCPEFSAFNILDETGGIDPNV